jgi:hypothetical protein
MPLELICLQVESLGRDAYERIVGEDVPVLRKPRRRELARQCVQDDYAGRGELAPQLAEGAYSANLAPPLDA